VPAEKHTRGLRSRIAVVAGGAAAVALLLTGILGQSSIAASPTPPVTAGLQLWYEADTTSYADGQAVTSWADKSGFARDLTSSGTNDAPIMRRNAVNGRAAIEFNGVQSLMKTYGSTFTITQPSTFFIVYKSLDPNTSARAFVFDSRNSSARQVFGRAAASDERMYADIDLDFPGVTYPFPDFQIWSGTFNGTQSSLYKNGTLFGSGSAGGSAENGFAVGGLSTDGQYGYDYTHSLVAEILYYSGALSAADRQAVTDWLNQKYTVTTPPTAPSNALQPTVSGTARDGSTLTASPGSWNGTQPLTYAYQWQRCNASGASCAAIGGATAATYAIAAADVGSTLAVTVTASNSAGSASASSAASAVVTAAPPANTALPSISGNPQVGSTLAATAGAWTGTAPLSFAYQWQRCDVAGANCAAVAGSTGTTYALAAADVGSTIRVQVTASNAAGNASAQSAQSLVIASAGGPAQNPPVTSGLQLWYEANTESYTEGQAVTTWTDKSGNGRNLTAFDAGSAPVYHKSVVNGRAAIEFDGATDLMKTYNSTFTIAQPDTFFIVYKSLDANTASRAYIFDSRDSANRQIYGRGGASDVRMYANIDLIASGLTYPFPSFQVTSGTFNGASSSISRNGTVAATGNAGSSSLNGLTVGGLNSAAQYGYDMSHSQIAEILFYSGSLSATDRDAVTSWLNQKYSATGPLTPPTVLSAPTISGTLRDGSTLASTTGSWSGSQPLTYAYQWRRCDSSGASCADISGATSPSYVLAPADVGSTITVVVTATNGAGFASAAAATTGVVAAAPPVNTALPTVSGTASEGSTLTATNGTWSGTPPIGYAYQWQRCDAVGANCVPVPGATAVSYLVATADVGSTIRVGVAATNPAGTVTAASAQTAVVASASGPPPPTSPPVTTGLQLWYEANTESYSEGQAVTTWTDKSGFGRNLTAFDASQAPIFHKSAVNGRAAIEFDGIQSLLKTYGSNFTLPQPTTFFIVYRSLDTASPGYEAYVFDSMNSSVRQLLGLGPAGNTELYADIDFNPPGSYPFPAYQVWSGTFNGANSSAWRNGVKVASGNAGGSGLSGFTVGALSTSGEYGYNYGHSLVAEILYYTGAMTDSDRAAVTNWLNGKYAAY